MKAYNCPYEDSIEFMGSQCYSLEWRCKVNKGKSVALSEASLGSTPHAKNSLGETDPKLKPVKSAVVLGQRESDTVRVKIPSSPSIRKDADTLGVVKEDKQ